VIAVAEMQARVFFHFYANHLQLPASEELRADIEGKQRAISRRFFKSQRHTLQVDFVQFMDELGHMIGFTPSPYDYLYSDPALAYKLMFGVNASYVYRLKGPHVWSGARQAIMELEERVERSTRTRECGVEQCEWWWTDWVDGGSMALIGFILGILAVFVLRLLG